VTEIPVDSNSPNVSKNLTTPYGELVDCACDTTWAVGDRVMASQDIMDGADIVRPAGSLGTVVCGSDVGEGLLPLLVAWDDWSGGHNGTGYCECPVLAAALDSGWWVECNMIEPAHEEMIGSVCSGTYSVGSRVVSTVDNPADSAGLQAGSNGTVVCGASNLDKPLLVSWDGWHDGHDGNDFCTDPGNHPPDGEDTSWWIFCSDVAPGSDVSCACDGVFEAGDRVRLLEAAGSLSEGSLGTVMCGGLGEPPLLVSWDNFDLGNDGNGNCACPSTDLPNHSGYFVDCDTVAKEYTSLFIDGFEDDDTTKWSARSGWWCPDGATDEGTPCPVDGDDAQLDPNGGCNSNPAAFGSITVGETICGTVGTFVTDGAESRDTDWYHFDIPASDEYMITVKSNVSLRVGFVDENGCSSPSLIEWITTTPGVEGTVTATLDAGTGGVFVASESFSGVPCSGYTVTLTQP
jgi:hypothetical protein